MTFERKITPENCLYEGVYLKDYNKNKSSRSLIDGFLNNKVVKNEKVFIIFIYMKMSCKRTLDKEVPLKNL